MSLAKRLSIIDMNASCGSDDSMMEDLSWSSDFTTPGKTRMDTSSPPQAGTPITSYFPSPVTPPSSKRPCALRLFDTPHTPRSLLRRASQSDPLNSNNSPARVACSGIKAHYQTRRRSSPRLLNRSSPRLNNVKRSSNESSPSPLSPICNPFQSTPMSDDVTSEKKRRKIERTEDDLSDIKKSLFTRLRRSSNRSTIKLDLNISRYKNEFSEVGRLGKGEFGEVYKCQNRMDGCLYAIKRLVKPIAGSIKEASSLREVHAHAVLGKHQHIVQYFSAWAEQKHMIIQNEYCNGGTLRNVITKHREEGTKPTEDVLTQVLIQVSKGMRYMHSLNLVHLDIKPSNIFISRREVTDDEDRAGTCYKIGDLGMVTSISEPRVEEGDSRYMPRELLDDNYGDLTKADIFSLALTIYEVASLKMLPTNGPQWHSIRDGKLSKSPNTCKKFHDILLKMIDSKAEKRFSPADIIKHKYFVVDDNKALLELRMKLNEEKLKTQSLTRELEKATKENIPNAIPRVSASRLVGQKFNRSMSIA